MNDLTWQNIIPTIQNNNPHDKYELCISTLSLNNRFPESYIKMIENIAGTRPSSPMFRCRINEESISIKLEKIDFMLTIDQQTEYSIVGVKNRLLTMNVKRIKFIPFAKDTHGNFLCFFWTNSTYPSVIHLDIAPQDGNSILHVASSFDEFLENLEDVEDWHLH